MGGVADPGDAACASPREWLERRRQVNMMPAFTLFWRADTLASEIAIRRTAEQGEFTTQEMAFLHRLHPHLEIALRTVKTQLTSVHKKCGVRSRSRLLALMMPRLSYD